MCLPHLRCVCLSWHVLASALKYLPQLPYTCQSCHAIASAAVLYIFLSYQVFASAAMYLPEIGFFNFHRSEIISEALLSQLKRLSKSIKWCDLSVAQIFNVRTKHPVSQQFHWWRTRLIGTNYRCLWFPKHIWSDEFQVLLSLVCEPHLRSISWR